MKGLIIIPFRDTPNHQRLNEYEQLKKVLDKIDMPHLLSIQDDDTPFNRGLLLNYAVAKNLDYDYYIFHDVDLVPSKKLLRYYKVYPKKPIHLGCRGQRYFGPNFIGGVFSISKKDFLKVNGFANNLSGWGSDDDILQRRLRKNKIYFTCPPKGRVYDLENLSIKEKLDQLYKNNLINLERKKVAEYDNINDNYKLNGIYQLLQVL